MEIAVPPSEHSSPLPLAVFPSLLLQCSLSLWCEGCILDRAVMVDNPTAVPSLHFDKLWISVWSSSTEKEVSLFEGGERDTCILKHTEF